MDFILLFNQPFLNSFINPPKTKFWYRPETKMPGRTGIAHILSGIISKSSKSNYMAFNSATTSDKVFFASPKSMRQFGYPKSSFSIPA